MRSIFCPFSLFTGLQTLTDGLDLCYLMMTDESCLEDVVGCRGCSMGVNLGGDTRRVNKKYKIFTVIGSGLLML